MNQRELLDVLHRATRVERWTEWVGGIEPVVRRLEQANAEKNEGELYETGTAILEIVFKGGVRNHEPAALGVAAEIFGLCQLEKLFDIGRERYFASHDTKPNELVRQIQRVFLGSLVSIAAGPSTLGVMTRDKREFHSLFTNFIGQLQESADAEDQQYLENCLHHSRNEFHFTGLPRHDKTLTASVSYPPLIIGAHPQAIKLLPGDCLFRELSSPGQIFGQALRDLGHTGIYLGLRASNADPTDWSNHDVVEMTLSGCQITTIAQFRQQAPFWGFYSINLDQPRRSAIAALARSYVGRCHYGVSITGYKNPVALSFRCDGFVEHCHESLPPGAPLPAHKWGLFEDDKWNTLTPAALRNCFFEKY